MRKLVMAMAMVAMMASPVLASQCPLLIKQINDATAGKTDANSVKARELAAEAQKLHEAGKHADSVTKADEAAKVINLQLKKK